MHRQGLRRGVVLRRVLVTPISRLFLCVPGVIHLHVTIIKNVVRAGDARGTGLAVQIELAVDAETGLDVDEHRHADAQNAATNRHCPGQDAVRASEAETARQQRFRERWE